MKSRHICALSGTGTDTCTVHNIFKRSKAGKIDNKNTDCETERKEIEEWQKAQINKQAIMPHEFVNSNH